MAASHPSDNRRFIVAGLFLGSGGLGSGALMRTNPGFLKPSTYPQRADLPRIMPWHASIRPEIARNY
jgi:hypothetical protein